MTEPNRPVLSNLVKGLRASLPECGRIKIGMKGEWKTSSNGAEFQQPKKLDHFLITGMDRESGPKGKPGNFLRDNALHAILGEKPTVIPIYLLFDEIEKNVSCRMMRVMGSKIACVGDGENAEERTQDGKIICRQCPCSKSDPAYTGKDKCKISTTFMVVIRGAEQLGGVWSYRTTSRKATENLLSSLVLVKNTTGGPLAWIPLEMRLVPLNTLTPEGQPTKVFRVQVVYPHRPELLREEGLKMLAARTEHQKSIALLEATNDRYLSGKLTPDEIADMSDEFYPEASEAAGPVRTEPAQKQPAQASAAPEPTVPPSRRGKSNAKAKPADAEPPKPLGKTIPTRGEEEAEYQEMTGNDPGNSDGKEDASPEPSDGPADGDPEEDDDDYNMFGEE